MKTFARSSLLLTLILLLAIPNAAQGVHVTRIRFAPGRTTTVVRGSVVADKETLYGLKAK